MIHAPPTEQGQVPRQAGNASACWPRNQTQDTGGQSGRRGRGGGCVHFMIIKLSPCRHRPLTSSRPYNALTEGHQAGVTMCNIPKGTARGISTSARLQQTYPSTHAPHKTTGDAHTKTERHKTTPTHTPLPPPTPGSSPSLDVQHKRTRTGHTRRRSRGSRHLRTVDTRLLLASTAARGALGSRNARRGRRSPRAGS